MTFPQKKIRYRGPSLPPGLGVAGRRAWGALRDHLRDPERRLLVESIARLSDDLDRIRSKSDLSSEDHRDLVRVSESQALLLASLRADQ